MLVKRPNKAWSRHAPPARALTHAAYSGRRDCGQLIHQAQSLAVWACPPRLLPVSPVPPLAQTWRLVTVRRRASSEREATGTTKGLSGMCSSLNLMETS